jgi:sugar lactone lactonase YvrE
MNISNIHAELGEGIYIDKSSSNIYWVDIFNNMLFVASSLTVDSYKIDKQVTTVLYVNNNLVYLTSPDGIVLFNTSTSLLSLIDKIPDFFSSESYRSNDAVMITNGIYIYGVMDRNLNTAGAIVVSKNKQSYVVVDDIFIPNTFINIPGTNDLLISDSMQYKTFKFQFSKNWETVVSKSTWLDLSEEKLTPDGGCISSDGRIFIAIWDGFKVIELNVNGNIVNEFKVPVPRPTNCALDIKEDKLFVTSAYDGLSSNKRKQYPLSGSIIEVDVRG